MHICVKNCSDEIIKHILEQGHILSDEAYADAVVYDGCTPTSFQTKRENGLFLIDAHGKTTDEIDLMLKNRLYSPIFFE